VVTTALYRDKLPLLAASGVLTYLTDSGIETDLIHHHGVALPEFATFPLLDDDHGRELLVDYFLGHGQVAGRIGVGFVLDTVTWRASPRWGRALGYDEPRLAAINRRAAEFAVELRDQLVPAVEPVVVNGVIGPHHDGYQPQAALTAKAAERYHSWQVGVLADTDVDMLTVLTLSDPAEAIGLARAARRYAMPLVVSFTVETDGRLPEGSQLAGAIEAVDAATDGYPAYYMINCAHPDHFQHLLDPDAAWIHRLRGIRVNASTRSHAEVDAAADLDEGDPVALGRACAQIGRELPDLVVFGGCCGSDLRHVVEIAAQLRAG
jgi:S-methylmethionine-dependent homocysteine/selenocysteine methylase